MRVSWFIVIVVLVGIGGGALYGYIHVAKPPLPHVAVTTAAPNKPAPGVILVVGSGEDRQVVTCQAGRCQTKSLPGGLTAEARFDGTQWYDYADAKSEFTHKTTRILRKIKVGDSETQSIIERTPLTSPRGTIISPDGRYVAFWLDNIDQPAERLTELWVYDVTTNSIRVLAERLYAPDIRTTPRWNSTSTYIWFVADVGPQTAEKDTLELITIDIATARLAAGFRWLPWQEFLPQAEHGVVDIAPTGHAVVYGVADIGGGTKLTTRYESGQSDVTHLKGPLPWLSWIDEETYLYAAQDTTGFTIWRRQGEANRFIARQAGVMVSAKLDAGRQWLGVAVQGVNKGTAVLGLDVTNGGAVPLGDLRTVASTFTLIQILPTRDESASRVAGTQTIADDEAVAFIEKNLPKIANQPTLKAQRIIVTQVPNTLYVDYGKGDQEERLLVTINDVVHSEWVVKARYKARGAIWQNVTGGGEDPQPARLYEWEETVGQWILKQSYEPGQN